MSGRIWPGALCYITHPSLFGRMVEVLYGTPVGVDEFRLPDGYPNAGAPTPGYWVIKFLGAPISAPCSRGQRMTIYASVDGRWLRPITPPPSADTTEDRSPCEVESA